MKKEFIIFAEGAELITFHVTTDENYLIEVEDLTGSEIDPKDFKIKEEFEERYFQIDPWYWFSGFEYE